jgi:hypothetical protein
MGPNTILASMCKNIRFYMSLTCWVYNPFLLTLKPKKSRLEVKKSWDFFKKQRLGHPMAHDGHFLGERPWDDQHLPDSWRAKIPLALKISPKNGEIKSPTKIKTSTPPISPIRCIYHYIPSGNQSQQLTIK